MMTDQYHLDLSKISMARYQEKLETTEMLPARQILKENIAENFAIFGQHGIENIRDLIRLLGSKEKIRAFSEISGLSVKYLTIFLREAKTYKPKLVYLREIPGVDPDHIKRLHAAGIRNTKQMFGRSLTREDRETLSKETGIPYADLMPLVGMSDLARLLGLGPVFVRLFYGSGIDSLETLARYEPDALDRQLKAENEKKNLSQVIPVMKDLRSYIEHAKELPKLIEPDE